MGRVINLERHRQHKAAASAFERWPRRLGHRPGATDSLADLPDATLGLMAELDQDATLALYDLVLGVRGWGAGERFPYLEPQAKVEALDAFLLVADQVRFELMHRLGWVEEPPAASWPLVVLARDFRSLTGRDEPGVPRLSPAYPRYHQVAERLEMEPQTVVRSAIPEALKAFRRRLQDGGRPPNGS
jgi:hypothetical protein